MSDKCLKCGHAWSGLVCQWCNTRLSDVDPKMISSIFYLRNQNDDLRRQLARADEECRRWRELSSSLKPTIRCMAMSHGLDCDEWPALADGLAAKVRAGEAKLAAAQAEIKRLRASLLGTEGRKG